MKEKHTDLEKLEQLYKESGYDINRKNSDLWLGNRPYIQIILTPTVPIIESIIGTVEYPIPLSALRKERLSKGGNHRGTERE